MKISEKLKFSDNFLEVFQVSEWLIKCGVRLMAYNKILGPESPI